MKSNVVVLSGCFVYFQTLTFMDVFYLILTPFHCNLTVFWHLRRWGLVLRRILFSFCFYLLGYWAILPRPQTTKLVSDLHGICSISALLTQFTAYLERDLVAILEGALIQSYLVVLCFLEAFFKRTKCVHVCFDHWWKHACRSEKDRSSEVVFQRRQVHLK